MMAELCRYSSKCLSNRVLTSKSQSSCVIEEIILKCLKVPNTRHQFARKQRVISFSPAVISLSLFQKFKTEGFISSIDALELGLLVNKLGGGRQKPSDTIVYEVGMRLLKVVGDEIRAGEPWLEVYHNMENFDDLYAGNLAGVIEIVSSPVVAGSLIYKLVEA